MKRFVAKLAGVAAIAVAGSAAALAMDEDTCATIQFSGASTSLGIRATSYTRADGTLVYNGRSYPIRLTGISVSSVSGEGFTGRGVIHNLNKLEEFDGTYAAGTGFTLENGRQAQALVNEHGVVMDLVDLVEIAPGLKVRISLDGVTARLR